LNIVVYGGSFDPVHIGHIEIVDNLSRLFDLVIVVPNKVSPFKDSTAASFAHRVNMLELVFTKERYKNVEISLLEGERDTPSYTIDTINSLKERLNLDKCDRAITLCIGVDAFLSIYSWKDYKNILKECDLILIKRHMPLSLMNKVDLSKIEFEKKIGCKINILDKEVCRVSSSMLKVDLAFGKFDNIQSQVAQYIKTHNLYKDYNNIVQSYQKFDLEPKRVEHIYRVAKMALDIGEYFEKTDKIVLGALLHDIGKRIAIEAIKVYYTEEEFRLLGQVAKSVVHAYYGERLAYVEFGIRDKDILNAIKYHTTGRPNMSVLEKIIFLADMVETERKGVDDIRELALCGQLDKAMLRGLEFSIDDLTKRNQKIQSETLEAYEYYKSL